MDLKKFIRSIPDYPKKGILFRDITTLIKDSKAFNHSIDKIIDISKKINLNKLWNYIVKLRNFKMILNVREELKSASKILFS